MQKKNYESDIWKYQRKSCAVSRTCARTSDILILEESPKHVLDQLSYQAVPFSSSMTVTCIWQRTLLPHVMWHTYETIYSYRTTGGQSNVIKLSVNRRLMRIIYWCCSHEYIYERSAQVQWKKYLTIQNKIMLSRPCREVVGPDSRMLECLGDAPLT